MPSAAALALTAGLLHVFNHSLFKSLLFFGAGAVLTATGERDMERLGGLIHRMPADRVRVPGRLRGDLGAAAAQRLRLGMADLPGDPAQPAAAVLGTEAPGARGRRPAGAVGGAGGGLLRQGLRRHLSRPPAHAGRRAGAGDRPLVARRDVRSRGAVPRSPASCRALFIDALAPVVDRLGRRPHAGADPASTGIRSCRSPRAAAPTTACWCSCSSRSRAALAALAIHRLASRRRCGARRPGIAAIRTPSPATQYTRRQLRPADPPRVRHRWCSARARRSRCRRPATCAPARLTVELRDLVWDTIYAPARRRRRLRGREAQLRCSS